MGTPLSSSLPVSRGFLVSEYSAGRAREVGARGEERLVGGTDFRAAVGVVEVTSSARC